MTAAEHPLVREYRPSMDKDTLHDWAVDAVAEMRKCHAIKADLLEAARDALDTELRRKEAGETYVVHTIRQLEAAIAKATGQ